MGGELRSSLGPGNKPLAADGITVFPSLCRERDSCWAQGNFTTTGSCFLLDPVPTSSPMQGSLPQNSMGLTTHY